MLFGNHMHMRPLAAAALALIVAVGGGTYAGFGGFSPKPAPVQTASPVIKDLQSLDENAQVFQQLNSMDQQETGDNGGNSL
jgi:hypothetical protein